MLLGLLSQGYSQIVTIGMQLISVPILISNWGIKTYGAWILLTTLPTYLSLVDFGFGQIAANDMTMRVASGDLEGANNTFQTACAMIGTIALMALIGFAAFVCAFPISTTFHLEGISETEASSTAFVLAMQVIVTIIAGLPFAGLRAVGLYSLMIAFNSTARLLESIAVLLASYFHSSFVLTAAGITLIRVLITVGATILLRRQAPWLKFGFHRTDVKRFYSMLGPSLFYMSYVLSYALNIQGTVLVIGALLNPEAVAVYSTARTLTRIGTTAANAFNHTLESEYSMLYVRSGGARFLRLFKVQLAVGATIILVYCASVLTIGQSIVHFWTRGRLAIDQTFLTLMAIAASLEMVWLTLQTPYVSTNRHSVFSMYVLGLSITCLFLTRLLLPGRALSVVGWIAIALNLAVCAFTLMRMRHRSPFPLGLVDAQ